MTAVIYFLILFITCISSWSSSILGSYLIANIQWVTYTKNCFDIFGNHPNFKNFPFFVKESKHKYLSIFYFFGIFNIIILGIFLWLWILLENNLYYLIGFIISFILSYVWWYFLVKKFLKKIKVFGFYSSVKTIVKFQDFQNKIALNLKEPINFILSKNNKKASRNSPFKFNQKRYQKKVQKLFNKNFSQEKHNIRLLNMFIRYLKTYSVFLKSMEKENSNYTIEINNKQQSIKELPSILIINFFCFVSFN